MKKIIVLILMVFILLTITNGVLAYSEPEALEVMIDGKKVQVKKINVIINEEPLESDVPPILYDSRTLVPVRFATQFLGGSVEWDPVNYQVKIMYFGKEIILTIDSSEVVIDGVKKQLPYNVPAKIVNDRTMVPLRFVAEELGCKVDWDPETWTGIITTNKDEITNIEVTDIIVEENGLSLPNIQIETTGNVSYKEYFLEEPYRLVIDINNAKLNISNKELLQSNGVVEIEVNKYPLKGIRASQFAVDPDVTRLVIDLDRYVSYDITTKDNKLKVSFLNKMKDISVEEIDERKGIVIDNTIIPQYNIIRLSNPDRIVVDLMDSILVSDKSSYDINTKYIKGIRTSQFAPDSLYNSEAKIVRIVIDINEDSNRPNLMLDTLDGKLVLYVDEHEFENIKYDEEGSLYRSININALKDISYKVNYIEESRLMEIKVGKDDVELETGMELIDDEYIDYIFTEEHGVYRNITIKFKKDIIYKIESEEFDDNIKILFLGKNEKFKDKTIIIDAGHGGKDPGATAPTFKIEEKDLNLKVAKKLNEKLIEAGFKTIMIRDNDEYIGLYERAEIANESNGDAFISIHFNSHPDSDIKGIQTFYCPSYKSEVKTEDNYPFAEAVHQGLLDALNSVDKGIRRRPELVVVRETKMVAALLELGFLTNPEEEKRIFTEEYQDKAVEGIVSGIIRYFEEKEFSVD
jgi:N-acetylmuramoyl-L-alanine amidase